MLRPVDVQSVGEVRGARAQARAEFQAEGPPLLRRLPLLWYQIL